MPTATPVRIKFRGEKVKAPKMFFIPIGRSKVEMYFNPQPWNERGIQKKSFELPHTSPQSGPQLTITGGGTSVRSCRGDKKSSADRFKINNYSFFAFFFLIISWILHIVTVDFEETCKTTPDLKGKEIIVALWAYIEVTCTDNKSVNIILILPILYYDFCISENALF